MISVEEARNIIAQHVYAMPPIELPLLQATGKLLAEDVYAIADIPAFPQSSMDGYTFSYADWKDNPHLIIDGEIAAGDHRLNSLPPGKAARIFTGAPVPGGADTVVMQEKVIVAETPAGKKKLQINDDQIQKGNNVRPAGSEIKRGECALEKNRFLTPAAIGFLAGIGIRAVKVFPHPSIIVIITGKELQEPGMPLNHGQVYESNSFSLTAALKALYINEVKVLRADDDLNILTDLLTNALQQCDIVLLTGGISTGDYDFVLQAAEKCGVIKLFHKIKQRPGKPLYFGKKEDRLVFGLPGNPSSVLTCFYEFVLPALSIMTRRSLALQTIQATLSNPFQKKVALTCFLKGYYDGSTVTILDAQESYRMRSFAIANCFVKIGEGVMDCITGEAVEVHLLPV